MFSGSHLSVYDGPVPYHSTLSLCWQIRLCPYPSLGDCARGWPAVVPFGSLCVAGGEPSRCSHWRALLFVDLTRKPVPCTCIAWYRIVRAVHNELILRHCGTPMPQVSGTVAPGCVHHCQFHALIPCPVPKDMCCLLSRALI